MTVLSSIAIALVAIGFEKAVIEPVAKKLFKRATSRLIDALPQVFSRIDHLVPGFIEAGNVAALRSTFYMALEEVTGEKWSYAKAPAMLEAWREFRRQYDPVRAAERLDKGSFARFIVSLADDTDEVV